MEIFSNVNIQGYEMNTGVYGGTAVCCSFMYVLINFFRIFLGLSTKNNPKKHMGKDKYRDKRSRKGGVITL